MGCVKVCTGVHRCTQVCTCVCKCTYMYVGGWVRVHTCMWVGACVRGWVRHAQVCMGVCGSLRKCVGVCECVCWMNFQNIFWRLESIHQRTLICILYKFFRLSRPLKVGDIMFLLSLNMFCDQTNN